MNDQPKEVKFGCCFCNEDMERSEIFNITVSQDGHEQYWWGHLRCFAEAMNPLYREFRDEFQEVLGEEES